MEEEQQKTIPERLPMRQRVFAGIIYPSAGYSFILLVSVLSKEHVAASIPLLSFPLALLLILVWSGFTAFTAVCNLWTLAIRTNNRFLLFALGCLVPIIITILVSHFYHR
jgi:hypothetical protein